MPEEPRRKIVDRADRMVQQSKRLRKLADELITESNDLREAVQRVKPTRKSPRKKKR